jgi:AcrR family transcriptional regulator
MTTGTDFPSASAPRTQADRRATTESRLLDAAFRIVAERGVRAITTAAVGELAGYSRGIVNHQFGSRDGLMIRLAETAQARFTPNPTGLRGREHVLGVIDAYLAAAASDPRQARVFLRLWAAAIGDEEPSLREAFTHRDVFFREHFEHAIAEGVTDGTIRTDIDPPSVAVALVGLVRGIAMQAQVAPDLASDDRIRAAALALVDRGL